MKNELIALLDRSRLFEHPQIAIETKGLLNYPFYFQVSPNYDRGDFEKRIRYFVETYLCAWSALLSQKPEVEFDWANYSSSLFHLFNNVGWDAMFDALFKFRKICTLDLSNSNTRFTFELFGNILAFKVTTMTGDNHRSGYDAILRICRDCNFRHGLPNSRHGLPIFELVHEVIVDINLKDYLSGEKKDCIDFGEVFDRLLKRFWGKYLEQISSTSQLIRDYKTCSDIPGCLIGLHSGIHVYANLTHSQAGEYRQKSTTWRNGNVKQIDKDRYHFDEGNDLLLRLRLRSSLPDNFLASTDSQKEYDKEQDTLVRLAGMLISQICSAQTELYLETRP